METCSMCTQCVLPNTTPGITFDEHGVCSYCLSHVPMSVRGEEKLTDILDRFRGRNKKYDCMIGISGGRDSTYTLWKLVHDYKMNVLAVNYKNPFTSEQAKSNMKNAVEQLNVDFVDWEFPNDVHKRATKKALKAWSYHPTSDFITIVCAHCKNLWPTFFKIARDHDVGLIVVGTNPLETASFKKAGLGGGARNYHKLSNLPRIIAKSMKELLVNPRYLTHCSWSTVMKMYLMAGHNSPYLRRRYDDISVERLFDYIRWNEEEVVSTITENLGWQKSYEVASSWRFDCRLDYARRLMYAATTGVTELRDLFSKMIREGMLTREDALERLKTEDVVPEKVANDVLAEIGLQLSDLNLDIDSSYLS